MSRRDVKRPGYSTRGLWSRRGMAVGALAGLLPLLFLLPELLRRVFHALGGGHGETAHWDEPLFYMVLLFVAVTAPSILVGAVVGFGLGHLIAKKAPSPDRKPRNGSGEAVVFYDGECGLCDRFVRFVLERDRLGHFHFASLQSDYAARALAPLGVDPRTLDTVVVTTRDGACLQKSAAAFYVLRRLSLGWRLVSRLRVLPAGALDYCYDFVARHRAAIPHSDACAVPRARWGDRFIDADGG